MRVLRIYIETSVAGGYDEGEFMGATRALFELFRNGTLKPAVSSLVVEELDAGAPARLKENMLSLGCEIFPVNGEVEELTDKYMTQGIVPERFRNDAKHIAAATVMGVDILASWNFKHIVNLNRTKAFNRVNMQEGYGILAIRTPRGVVEQVAGEQAADPPCVREGAAPYRAKRGARFSCVGFKHELMDVMWERIKDMPEAEQKKCSGYSNVAYFRALGEMSREQGWPDASPVGGYTLVRTAEEYIDEVLAEKRADPGKRFRDVEEVWAKLLPGRLDMVLSK